MSSLLRIRAIRPLRWRLLSNTAVESTEAVEKHARATAVQWKWFSLLVGIPTCGFMFLRSIVYEEHHEPPEHVSYEHIRIRKVQFPWGGESLFHSKHNYSPDAVPVEESETKENFISAWMRKKMEDQKKKDDKLMAFVLRENHQKMMEYIEKKKFTQYPHLPSYARMFSHPNIDLHDPITRRPISFDD